MNPESLQSIAALMQRTLEQIEALLPSPTVYEPDLNAAYHYLKSGMGASPDVVFRWIEVPVCPSGPVLMVYIEGLVDSTIVDEGIITPLLTTTIPPTRWSVTTLKTGDIIGRQHWSDILTDLAQGNTLLFVPDLSQVWSISAKKIPQRSISRPQTELSTRGSNDALSEVLGTQMSQVRSRFGDPHLRFHRIVLGRMQQEAVAVTYIHGLANPALVQVSIERLHRVSIDGRFNGTVLAGLIRDHPRSIFPTIRSTGRLDATCQALLEGKVVILVDGDPDALIAPAPLIDFYRTAMDYSDAWYDVSFVRLLRIGGWAVGVYLPALYIALTQVNTNLIPHALLIITAGAHAGLPFPPVVEALIMVFVIEILREAALRLPKVLSPTIGTVGAIIVGTAVVKAGIVSPQMIFVITLTALGFYTVPVYELTGSWRVVNLVMIAAAAIMGIYGVVIVTVWFIGALISLESFGVPYFEPMAPFRAIDWRDLWIRVPWTWLRRRPTSARPMRSRNIGPSVTVPPPNLKRRRL